MINDKIANIILYVHYLLILFVLVGHSLLPKKFLKYYIILIIMIFIDWNDFDGQCILTRLESYFRTGIWKQKPALEENAPEVFRPFINKLFNVNLNRLEASKLNNLLFIICGLELI